VFGRILDGVLSFMTVLAALLLLFITFSIGYSVFTRQFNLPMPVWVVQINEYAMLWITFLTTAWVLARQKHASVQILVQRLGGRGKKTLIFLHNLVGALLCGILCYYGAMTTIDHFLRRVIDVGSIDFPKAYVLMIIPVGFFLLTVQFSRNMVVAWLKKPGEFEKE
jgi:C4-dicarboxylate transporter, DctQ subunit